MVPIEQDLSACYDREAAAGERVAMGSRGRRDDLRADFIKLLLAEDRRTVIDVGSGPGGDIAAFSAAGVDCVGLDLSMGNAQAARTAGPTVVPASLFLPPFRPASFDAGWTMSTLLHVPDQRFDEAIRAITSLLAPGSPLAIGLWGGLDRENGKLDDHFGPPRFFSSRTDHRIQRMLGGHGLIESFDSWPHAGGEGRYQFAILRL
ncbi:MAG: SAM-dependent methyltransferase [Ilumatobacter sp.]|jgi:SAM-dependent methyltransferase